MMDSNIIEIIFYLSSGGKRNQIHLPISLTQKLNHNNCDTSIEEVTIYIIKLWNQYFRGNNYKKNENNT